MLQAMLVHMSMQVPVQRHCIFVPYSSQLQASLSVYRIQNTLCTDENYNTCTTPGIAFNLRDSYHEVCVDVGRA